MARTVYKKMVKQIPGLQNFKPNKLPSQLHDVQLTKRLNSTKRQKSGVVLNESISKQQAKFG